MKPLNRRRRRARSGLTLLEILVVVVLIAIGSAVLMPRIGGSREVANRVKCSNNLRAIGTVMMMYAGENRGEFPRSNYKPGAPPTFHWDAGDGGKPVNPFVDAPWNGYENDVPMAIFLLIRSQETGTEVFTCPSGIAEKDVYGAAPGASAQNKASFTSLDNLSYSFANPYPSAEAEALGYRWNSTLGSDFAIGADINPGKDATGKYDVTLPTIDSSPKDKQKGNSPNHQGRGQNVLFGDMHVEFAQDAFAGMRKDNIYTVSGHAKDDGPPTSKVVVGSPAGPHDSVLLPAYK